MRIAGGEWRGRALKVPPGDVLRPTQDRVREALFSMLMHETPGAHLLDLFAGVGGVGLEALSRGLVRADVVAWLETFAGAPFDVAFADPPYELGVQKGYVAVLATLAERNVVKPGGLFVAELTSRQLPDESPLWDLCRDRVYGQTRLAIYRRKT